MAKIKTRWICNNCTEPSIRHMGQCPHCKAWNTLEEEVVSQSANKESKNRYQGFAGLSSEVENLEDIEGNDYIRESSEISEFNRVLGGGFVNGQVVLIGGDPGIGKSTLLLQTVANLAKKNNVLYVSGEESKEQISMRASRLKLNVKGVRIFGEIELEKIADAIINEKPAYVVIDSIQTLYSSQLSAAPGSVSQVKECASQLNRIAKANGITIIMVCHVTKEGELAGPRALEHIVDTVLYFEGDKNNQYRMIRAFKNRFGPINEIGIFSMSAEGLTEVSDPTGIFAGGNKKLPGASIFVSQEGNRSILVEIQALLDTTPLPNPIRRSIGLDINRLQMLCAVINKYVSMPIYGQNVFVSLIGGMKFADTGIDLPAFLSMISSFKNQSIIEDCASFGEIGLTGELRQVQNAEDRIKEAARMGIKTILIPKMSSKDKSRIEKENKITIIECKDLHSAIQAAF